MLWPCAYWSHPADRHIHFPQHTVGQELLLDTPGSSAHEERYLFMWGIFSECCFEDAGMGAINGEILERKAAPGIEGFLSRGRHCWTMASKVFCGQKKLLPAFLTTLDFSSYVEKEVKSKTLRSVFDRHNQVIESEHLTCFDCSLGMGRLTQQVVFVKHLRSEDTNQCRKSQ